MALIVGTPGITGFTLNTGDEFILPPGIVVSGPAIADGVIALNGGVTITIMGALYGVNSIDVGIDNVASSSSISILAGATAASNVNGDAIVFSSSNGTINNAGLIAGGFGINLYSEITSGSVSTINSGQIITGQDGFFNSSKGKATLTNTGTILSYDGQSYDSVDSGIDIVINKGLMSGDVVLGLAADSYDGRGGRVVGTVSGGTGIDKLTGGDLVDRMNGGLDADILTGGKGKDILTGGAGDAATDKFYFNSTLEVGDVISDFTTADFIVIKSSAFGNVAKGALASAAFRANTSGKAEDTSDRFIYETDSDRLWYDSNGSASGGVKLMIADIVGDVNFTKGEILVV